MNILKEGDKKKAICEDCNSTVSMTFALRDVPFSDGSGIVKNVLAGVCDGCNRVIAIPHQSVPAIKRQLEKQRKSINTRVPSHMVDILSLASNELGAGTDFSSGLIKYYIHGLSTNKISSSGLVRSLKSDLAQGRASKRLSLKGQHIFEETETLKSMVQINSTTDLLKSVVLKINDDILIHKRSKPIMALRDIIAATA